MKKKLTTLIVEPSDIICLGLQKMAESIPITICATTSTTENLDVLINRYSPEVLIINPSLPSPTPKQSLTTYLAKLTNTEVVALVYQHLPQALLKHFTHIIDIYDTTDKLSTLIDNLTNNRVSSDKTVESYELSERETDVLTLLVKGMLNKEIADKLNISIHTVISHRKNIVKKTGIKTVAGLTVYAMLNNLMD